MSGYTLGPSLRELHSITTVEAFARFLPWLALSVPSLAVLGFHGSRVLGSRAFERLVLLIAAPVAITGLLSLLAGVSYNVCYVAWVAVPAVVLLAAGATRWRRWPVTASLLVLSSLFGTALAHRHFSDSHRNEDMRALSAYLTSLPGSDPIFVVSGYMASPARYYLGQGRAIYQLPDSQSDSSRAALAFELIDSVTPAGKTYWLVYSREFHGDPRGTVRGALQQRDGLRVNARFAGATLYRGIRPLR